MDNYLCYGMGFSLIIASIIGLWVANYLLERKLNELDAEIERLQAEIKRRREK